jgi:hypothetical protein
VLEQVIFSVEVISFSWRGQVIAGDTFPARAGDSIHIHIVKFVVMVHSL